MTSTSRRLVVIGLDGATFDLIAPWAAAGDLPNLQRLMAEGSWGPLRSVVHPFTAQAWTSMVTGAQQGKHRVFDFWERDFNTYGFRLLNASHRALPALWMVLSRGAAPGPNVIILNVPQTYPPERVRGVLVSGRDTPGLGASYTYPAELKDELDRISRTPYVIVPDDWLWTQRGRPDLARAELLREVEVRFDAAQHLMATRPWDLAFFVVSATDGAAHFFWKYHDPSHPLHDPATAALYGDTIHEVYCQCDRRIGELLARLDSDCNVLVVSDHGQGPLGPQAIHLNLWLAEQQLLHFRQPDSSRSLGEQATALAARAVQWGKRTLYGRVRFQTLTKLRRLWPDSLRTRLGAEAFFPDVDWSRTRAFSEELRGNIWINLVGRDPHGVVAAGAEYEALRDQIIATLPQLRDAQTGARPIRRVWRREELFCGPYLERFPDLIVEAHYPDMFKPHSAINQAAARQMTIEEMAQRAISGCHRMNGIFIAWGPDIQPGGRTADAALIDVAPTVLHLLRHPVLVEMDGRVLGEVLRPGTLGPVQTASLADLGFGPAGVELGYSDEEAERVRQRLAGLGYLG